VPRRGTGVDRSVTAGGVEPRGESAVEFRGIFAAEAEERFLHRVAGAVVVAGNAGGEAHQRALEAFEGSLHPRGTVCSVRLAHVWLICVLTPDIFYDARAGDFLDRFVGKKFRAGCPILPTGRVGDESPSADR